MFWWQSLNREIAWHWMSRAYDAESSGHDDLVADLLDDGGLDVVDAVSQV